MTDDSPRRLFLPAARAADPSIEVEAREQTPAGWVVSRGARRVTVIERMERVGAITHRQGCAARQIYRDYALGVACAHDRDAAVGGGGMAGYTDAQLDAIRRYRMVRDKVGGRLWELVWNVVLRDVSVPEYAKARGLNRASTQAILRVALDLAGDVLGTHE